MRAKRDTALRTGPGPHFSEVVVLKEGQRFGRQSRPNVEQQDNPQPRDAKNGYVFGYRVVGGKSGWVQLYDLEHWEGGRPLTGPAQVDFHVDRTPCPKKKKRRFPYRKASGHRTVKTRELYLRYNPHGSAFGYLLKGDEVELQKRSDKQGYYCVSVKSSTATPIGSEGWVTSSALAAPN